MFGKMEGIAFVAIILAIASPILAQNSLCSGIPDGVLQKVANPHNCSAFYECFNGVITGEGICPSNYWFDANVQTCVVESATTCAAYPVNPNCTSGLVDYYPYPYDCGRYIECYHGVEEVHNCPDGLWYNAQQKRCVDQSISDCGQYTVSPPWTTPVPTCWGVLPGQVVLYPYPDVCSRYYRCDGAQLSVEECASGYWFSQDRQMCDWPELVNCDSDVTPPPIDPGSGFDDPRCANGNTDYWPYPECSQFVECYNGLGYLMDCPAGLYFDSNSKDCRNPADADCGRVTTEPNIPTTDPNWSPDPLCPWPSTDRYLFPYSGDCTKFWECSYGERTLMYCPPDLYFNPVLLVCDYPYEAGCSWARDE